MSRNIEISAPKEDLGLMYRNTFASVIDLLKRKGAIEKIGLLKREMTVVTYPYKSVLKEATVIISSDKKLEKAKKISIEIDGRGKLTVDFHKGKYNAEMTRLDNNDNLMVGEVSDFLRAVKQVKEKLEFQAF